MTPVDEYQLFKEQALAALQNPGLFDRDEAERARNDREQASAEPEPVGGLVGVLGQMDSEPPTRYN